MYIFAVIEELSNEVSLHLLLVFFFFTYLVIFSPMYNMCILSYDFIDRIKWLMEAQKKAAIKALVKCRHTKDRMNMTADELYVSLT